MHRSAFARVEGLELRTLLSRAIGIDIADYQHPNGAAINWTSVYNSGVQFAYVKATQANNYINKYFANDAANATAASIVVGAYDFADYTVDATTEANHFLSTASSYVGPGFMRPMLDVEIATSDTASQVSTWVNTWCNAIYQDTGVKPIVYTYISYASSYLNSSVTQWPLWMSNPNGQSAQTGGPNATAPWSSWSIWQYSTNSTVNGITGNVDKDVAYGDMTSYVIPQLVGGSTQFKTGQTVYVNASSGLEAYSTYASNGSYVTEPNGTPGTIQGGPVYINGYLRWPVIYSGSSTLTWSAGAYLAADVPSVTSFSGSPNPVTAGNSLTLTANVTDPASMVRSVLFYRESDGTAGLQSGRGGDTLLGYGNSNGAGGWTIATPTAGLSGSVTYYAVATNAGGTSSATADAAVTVRALPTVTLTGSGPDPATTAQPLSFTGTVSGGVPNGETVTLEDTTNNNATVATATLDGGSATFPLPAGTLAIGTHNLIAVYGGDANFAPNQSAPYAQTVQATPPTLSGTPVINGDDPNGLYNAAGQTTPGQQRSMVEDVVYTFNEPVVINDANSAFTVQVAGAAGGTLPATLYAQAVAGFNGTQWAVSLTGQPEGTIGSITNGEYSITINPAYVFAAGDGTTSMPAGSGRTDRFYRLYGDVFGTENVTALDYNRFKSSLATYNPMFDNYNTGNITALEYNLFKKDLSLNYAGDGFVTTL